MSFPTVIYGEPGDERKTSTAEINLPIGTKMIFPSGDEFRWVNVGGTAITAAFLNQGEATASPFGVDENPTAASAASALTVTVDVASDPGVDVLKYGVLVDETNSHSYEIEANTEADPTVITLASAEGLITDLEAADTVRFYKSPFMDVIVKPATPFTALAVGFGVVAIAAASYGWVKSRGWTPVTVDGSVALVVGDVCMGSVDDEGAVGTEATTEQVVGVVYNIGSDATGTGSVDGEIFATLV